MRTTIVSLDLDISAIDDAQQKADKLKATLPEVQEIIRQTNSSVADIEDKRHHERRKNSCDLSHNALTRTRDNHQHLSCGL